MTHSVPTTTSERILVLDVVRGIALLGIFIMNIPFFSMSGFAGVDGSHLWPEWWDRIAETLRDVLFSGKFNSMFSMLFAVGFTIQLERLLQRDPDSGLTIYRRRIFWLLAFGVAHACIFWTGDVLHMYALLGFVLIAMRKLSDRILIVLIVASLLYTPITGTIRLHTMTPEDLEHLVEISGEWEARDNAAYGRGSFVEAMIQNTRTMIALYSEPEFLRGMLGFYVQIFTTMLIGLLLGRHAFFQKAQSMLGRVRQVQWWTLGVGVTTGVIFGAWEFTVENASQPTIWRVVAGTCYMVCRVSMTVFYVATLIRGVYSDKWRAKLLPFALAGRMPLTNYLAQTLIATFVFFAWGVGLWGRVGPALGLVFPIAIYFLIQIPCSRWWLSRYALGPMEYLWRLLTYGRASLTRTDASGA